MKRFGIAAMLCMALAVGGVTGCAQAQEETSTQAEYSSMAATDVKAPASTTTATAATQEAAAQDIPVTTVSMTEGGIVDTTDLFTDRDLRQGADTSNATTFALESGQDVTITDEGVYVISGTAEDVTITVQADETAKVQLVLDGVEITNQTEAAIYVVSADKVFVTTADGSTNTLTVSGEFAAVGEDNVDGVVFSKDDICFNGTGTLIVNSTANGLVGKDDVKITGGTYQITASNHAIQGKDSVAIADGSFVLNAGKDGIHSENSDDDTKGYVYIAGGTFEITAGSDGIEGDLAVQIDGGTFTLNGAEGIEGTYVQINGGDISINASDDAINGTAKSSAYTPTVEINNGTIVIVMAQGDTDALDVNGNLYVNGGTVDITGQSPFDFDGEGVLNGGTVIVNGQQVSELTNSMMGGGMMGGMMGGQMGARTGSGRMGGVPQEGDEDGELPQDGEVPQDGEMPQDGELPQGGEFPRDGKMLKDGEAPLDGEMPQDGGRMGKMLKDGETTETTLSEEGTSENLSQGTGRMGGGHTGVRA